MGIIKKTNHEKLHNELEKIRKNIPEKYNQVGMLDYLDDPDVDLMFSITTRSDGKTFNYLYALAKLNIALGFTTCVIVRHMEIRNAMFAQIQDVYQTMKDLNEKLFNVTIDMDYIKITYGENTPFIICDLNNANDLKNYSAVLRKCNLILYDEFLAVGGEYAPSEFAKWKVIFETMDRGIIPSMDYTNKRRKALFLGNPVDFSSEFLAHWKLYHYLENQPMNTIEKHKNFIIERRKNINGQANKNNRIFGDDGEENEAVTGEFHINDWSIKEPKDEDRIIRVKTTDKYICIHVEAKPVLEVTGYEKSYDYNTELVDNTDHSTYCKDNYYRDNFARKYTKNLFNFANQYSKTYILENYPKLNINRLIKETRPENDASINTQAKQLQEADNTQLKRRLIAQYYI